MEAIDWQIVATAIAAFIVAAYTGFKGYKDKKRENAAPATVVAGVIQDNTSIRENTEALREHTREMERFNRGVDNLLEQMRLNQAAFTRFTDILLLDKRR